MSRLIGNDEIVGVHNLRCNLDEQTGPKTVKFDGDFFQPSRSDASERKYTPAEFT